MIRFVPRPHAPADRPAALPGAEVVRPDFHHHQPQHHGPVRGGQTASDLRADAAGHAADEPADDYRDRMVANLAGLAVLAMLIAGGLWIAVTMADQRKNQDCVLSGRPGCTPVPVPVQVPVPKLPPGP
ncbi:hypothetical protein CCR97_24360 [Rhodoplanes elegans]|uniref:Uncharacterized protein n=1 Tax=Rhodoplanes elegans TaxID=29408 RepID=A0A327KG94_9BRAD|nr:hypothetical protein [Rhodoplanes elegans]RAI37779.1 hypothetical protein CH338_14965 [Rhodoplanes elegans]